MYGCTGVVLNEDDTSIAWVLSKVLPALLLDLSCGEQRLSYPRFSLFCVQQVFVEKIVPQVQDRADFLRYLDGALRESR